MYSVEHFLLRRAILLILIYVWICCKLVHMVVILDGVRGVARKCLVPKRVIGWKLSGV